VTKGIYLDHHATTPVDPAVIEVMTGALKENWGNASSLQHAFGRRAHDEVEVARVSVAKLIGATPEEIIFTSGATESNNLAILGAARKYAQKGKHAITCSTEHRSVLDPFKHLETESWRVTVLGVRRDGSLASEDLKKALLPETTLVSIMAANNEIGTIHPIAELAKIARAAGVLFHVDATQAAGKIPLDVNAMGIDLLSFSAHKMHGPKGAAALYVRAKSPHVRLEPIVFGGGHESALRSGTLNVPAIAGFGKACEIALANLSEEPARLAKLRDRLKAKLLQIPFATLNGAESPRLANNLNMSFQFVEAESLLKGLESAGIAVSSGSACAAAETEPSHVLKAIGVSEDIGHGSLRFGVGRFNTEQEIDAAADAVRRIVAELRSMSPLYQMAKAGKLASSVDWKDA